MKREKEGRVTHSLFSVWNFLLFFCVTGTVVGSALMLFFWGLELPRDVIQQNATYTFINVLVLTLLFTLADGLRRKLTIERPVKRLLAATQRLAGGDFSTRLPPPRSLGSQNEFDVIFENFNLMARELASTETLRTDFISNVSHELKTPLSIIQNYAALLEDPTLSPQTRLEYAKIIGTSTRRLNSLITNILKLNKLENQQIYP